MTPRQRLHRCYFHQELDRPGIYCRTGFPADDPSYDPLRRLLHERTERKARWNGASVIAPQPAHHEHQVHSEQFDREVTTLTTPKGTLTRTRLIGRHHQPGMIEHHLLADRNDAEAYLSMPTPVVGGRLDGFFEADRKLGHHGITEVQLGLNPAGRVAELFGSENFALMSVTDRGLLEALCEREMGLMLKVVGHLCDGGVGPYFALLGQEYVTPPLHSPRDFEDFNVRYDKPILDRIHERGGRVHVHCHGSIRRVFDGFREMGADVLHPWEAPPMGDITAAEAKAKARGRLTLEGNIQIADMYEKSPGQIRAQTEALIATCFDDRHGLIICPTASPYIYGAGEQCYRQFEAMINTVHAWAPVEL